MFEVQRPMGKASSAASRARLALGWSQSVGLTKKVATRPQARFLQCTMSYIAISHFQGLNMIYQEAKILTEQPADGSTESLTAPAVAIPVLIDPTPCLRRFVPHGFNYRRQFAWFRQKEGTEMHFCEQYISLLLFLLSSYYFRPVHILASQRTPRLQPSTNRQLVTQVDIQIVTVDKQLRMEVLN